MRTAAICCVLGLAATAGADGWKYVVPKPGDPFAHPQPLALALSATKPADLKEGVRYRGTKQRYARLAYGTGRTAAVTIVLDEVGRNDVDLYLDANRDNEITEKDRVAGDKLTWRAPLKAVVHQGNDVNEYPRTVAFRYSPVSRTLSAATCGYVEGTATLAGKDVLVRRTDGDANGLFADARDRVWIDVNTDGIFAAGDEEFLFAPILLLGDKRVALRADAVGRKLSLATLEGTGKLRLKWPAALKAEQVAEVVATFQSRDGVVATVRQSGGEVTVPTGAYRLSSLLLTLADGKTGEWGYVFTDNGGKPARWHDVGKDATIAIDPIGKLDFAVEAADECKAGDALTVAPRLYTGEGLLIERVYRGAFSTTIHGGGCHAGVALTDGETTLSRTTSGFA